MEKKQNISVCNNSGRYDMAVWKEEGEGWRVARIYIQWCMASIPCSVRRPVWSQPVLLTPPFQPDIKRVRFIHGLKYAGILTENLPRAEFSPLTYSLFNSKENYLPLYNLTGFSPRKYCTSIRRKNRRKDLTLTLSFLRTLCTVNKQGAAMLSRVRRSWAGCGVVKLGAA